MSTLIDLGELAPAVRAPVSEPPATVPVRHRRPVVLVLVALLALLTVASGTVPAEPMRRLYRIHALGDAPILFTGDRVYTIDTSSGARRLDAYDLGDGRELWSTATTLPLGQGWGLAGLPGTVLLSNYSDDPGASMVAFDAVTGAVRWGRSGGMLAPVPHLGALFVEDLDGVTVRLVDAVTGAVRWSGAIAYGCGYGLDSDTDPHLMATICPDNTLRVADLATGRTIASRAIPRRPPYTGPEIGDAWRYDGQRLTVADGLAVVSVFDGPTLTWSTSAYDLPDLAPRWTDRSLPPDMLLVPCPPANLCAYGERPRTIVADTGEIMPLAPADSDPVQADVTSHRAGVPPAVVLAPFDAPFDIRSHDAVVFVGRPGDGTNAPRFVVAGTTWVYDARADASAAGGWRYRPIGRIPGVYATRCVAYGGASRGRLLACATAPDVLTVWSLPDPAG